MKKFFIFSLLSAVVIMLFVTGCWRRERDMAKPTEDGSYQYENKDLGFNLKLPAEFQYYQVQRKTMPDFVDVEIFVPTSDKNYQQEVEGYAKPVVVRIYNRSFWEGIREDSAERAFFRKAGEKRDKIYALGFWQTIPIDWQSKWTEGMKEKIMNSLKAK